MRVTKDTAEKALNTWLASFRPETASKYRSQINAFITTYNDFNADNIERYLATIVSDSYKQSTNSVLTRFARFIEQTVLAAEPAEEVQTELAVKAEAQTEAQPLPDHVKAELDRRAQLTREFLEIGARFRSLPPEAVKRATDTLRNALDAALDNFYRSHIREMVEWTAQDWEAADRNASGLFAELRKDKAVIKAFEALLQIVEVTD